jgi:hypothetical protein
MPHQARRTQRTRLTRVAAVLVANEWTTAATRAGVGAGGAVHGDLYLERFNPGFRHANKRGQSSVRRGWGGIIDGEAIQIKTKPDLHQM